MLHSVNRWLGHRGVAVARVLAAVLCGVLLLGPAACGFWFLETRSAPTAIERQAPRFTLPNSAGEPVSLERLLERGPVVVVFYRGHW